MGPLFSALIIAPVFLALWVLAFIVTRLFQPTLVAFRAGALFVAGFVGGTSLAGAALALFLGGGTLVSTGQVIGYLSALAGSGLFGGALVLWASIKLRVLTLCPCGAPR